MKSSQLKIIIGSVFLLSIMLNSSSCFIFKKKCDGCPSFGEKELKNDSCTYSGVTIFPLPNKSHP
jgi:hypothetical protein